MTTYTPIVDVIKKGKAERIELKPQPTLQHAASARAFILNATSIKKIFSTRSQSEMPV